MEQNPFYSSLPLSEQREHHPSPVEKSQLAGFLQWWYYISLFSEPSASASVEELEFYRRGTTMSQVLLALIVLGIFVLYAAVYLQLTVLLIIVLVAIGLLCWCVWLNRTRQVMAAALITLVTFMVVVMGGSVLPASHIPPQIILFAILVAAATLPRQSIPIVTLINCVFLLFSLTFFPQTMGMGMTGAMKTQHVLFTPDKIAPLMADILLAIVSTIWANGIADALKRANRAEEVTRLEADLSQRVVQDIEKKRQLEESTQHILETHRRFANGDYSIRAVLGEGNVLWQISGLLNNLLARFQSVHQMVLEQERRLILLRAENAKLSRVLNGLQRANSGPLRSNDLPRTNSEPLRSSGQWRASSEPLRSNDLPQTNSGSLRSSGQWRANSESLRSNDVPRINSEPLRSSGQWQTNAASTRLNDLSQSDPDSTTYLHLRGQRKGHREESKMSDKWDQK